MSFWRSLELSELGKLQEHRVPKIRRVTAQGEGSHSMFWNNSALVSSIMRLETRISTVRDALQGGRFYSIFL